MKTAKIILCMAAVLLALLLLPACGAVEGKELSQRLIIEAIGIDKSSDGVRITLQTLDTHTLGTGSDPNESEKITGIYSLSGETVGQALSRTESVTGLSPLYSQARMIVLGKDLAMDNVSEPLDFFLREYNARSDILIAVAAEKAEDIVSADLGEAVADAVVLEDAVTAGSDNGRNVFVPLYQFMNLILTETDTAYCPVIELRDAPITNRQEIYISGTAFFRNNALDFIAGKELTEGLLFLTDKVKNAVITVDGEKGKYTLSIISTSTRISTRRQENGSFIFGIRTKIKCDITQFGTRDFENLQAEEAKDAERSALRHIKEQMENSIRTYFYERRYDVCRFGRRVNLKYPRFYELYKERMFSEDMSEIRLTVDVTVRRTGKESL